jgi:hypothetical protein
MKKEEQYQIHLSKVERKGKSQEEINQLRIQKFNERKENTK